MSGFAIANHPSPNHGDRKGSAIDILLLHYTDMADDEEALAWLCNKASQVSSHYFVHRDGRVLRLVPEEKRAWHAGAAVWAGDRDINSRSIGIEIANAGHRGGLPSYPAAQIEAVIRLCRDIAGRHPIPPHRVLAHSDVAPARKRDPGERFPWQDLTQAGVGHFVEPAPIQDGMTFGEGDSGAPVQAIQQLLALYGYGIAVTGRFDQQTAETVTAFQRHFRPQRVDGIADRSTFATLQALLEALA